MDKSSARSVSWLLWLALVLSGCASSSNALTPEEFGKIKPELGLVVASYARDSNKDNFDSESFFFHEIGKRKRYSFGQTALPLYSPRYDFDGEDGCGTLVVMAVPAGHYEFNDFQANYSVLGGGMNLSAGSDYSIPFDVQPGHITYVGEVRISRTRGRSFLGLYREDSASFRISKAYERDMAIFKKRYPENKMEVDVAHFNKDLSSPLVKIVEE